MYIAYEEFEKVMSQCHEVFTSWDDEYDKLQDLKRDIVKKKRDEHLKRGCSTWSSSGASTSS